MLKKILAGVSLSVLAVTFGLCASHAAAAGGAAGPSARDLPAGRPPRADAVPMPTCSAVCRPKTSGIICGVGQGLCGQVP